MRVKAAIQQADRNARFRDKELKIDIKKVNEQERKANEQGYGLYKVKAKNKADFVQIITENVDLLIRSKYLSNAEMAFIFSINPLIEMHSNAIADDTGQFLSVSAMSKYLSRDLSGTSRIVNGLIEKGILFEFVNAADLKEFKRSVTERPIFANPEIVYCGDRNRINATLCRLVIQHDVLERKKVHLSWKVWLNTNHEHGTLYRRKTYLQYRNHNK